MKKDLIEVEEITRVEYEDDDSYYILDWDAERGWTNAFRDRLASHIWYPCELGIEAKKVLEGTFRPIAEKLGVPMQLNSRKMVEAAVENGPGLIRSFAEESSLFGRSIWVEEHRTAGGRIIWLRERPNFH